MAGKHLRPITNAYSHVNARSYTACGRIKFLKGNSERNEPAGPVLFGGEAPSK